MLRFYVLSCRNMYALKRHFKVMPIDQTTFVINTLDKEFENEAVAYCQSQGAEVLVTGSNGTASVGKNSVIDIFEQSSYDHFVLIDGDDYLTPHGVWTYNYIAEMDDAPDVLALEYQYGLWRESGYGFNLISQMTDGYLINNPYLGCTDPMNVEKIMPYGARVFLQKKRWWHSALAGNLVRTIAGDDFSNRLNLAHKKWVNLAYKYIGEWETHHRIVLCSRKAIDGFRYDPEFAVGEDTLLYLRYKDAYVRGDLKLKHYFDRYPTYVYDTRVNGVVVENKNKDHVIDLGWCEWLEQLSGKFEEMESEGLMHEATSVPIINDDIEWPSGYTPDTLGLANYPGLQKIIYS